MDTLSETIIELLELTGHTPKSAAKLSGLSRRTIEGWISGAHIPRTLQSLMKFADGIGAGLAKPALAMALAGAIEGGGK